MVSDGPYKTTSLEGQVAAWREWQALGNRPEAHDAVRPFDDAPPDDENFEILGEAQVKEQWSDQSFIQCNMCQRQHKFRNGGFLASYSNGWWYVVGPDCGGERFHEQFNRAQNLRAKREAEEVAGAYIRSLLFYRLEWLEYIQSIEQPVTVMFKVWNGLKTSCPSVFTALTQAAKSNGTLTLERQTRERNPDGTRKIVFEAFTRMSGYEILRSGAAPSKPFRDLDRQRHPILSTEISLDDLNRQILKWDAEGKLDRERRAVREQIEIFERLRQSIDATKKFVAPENLKKISDWTQHERSSAPARVYFEFNGSQLTISGADGQHRTTELKPLLEFSAHPPAITG